MGYVKHQNPREKRRDARGNRYWATAPYNFVPLPDKVIAVNAEAIPPHDAYAPGTYSGYLNVTLTTKTPLYVRSMMTQEIFARAGEKAFHELDPADQQARAQFFTVQNAERPVIPGSSLRGMLRALVEIVGYGKVQPVSGEQLIFRAIGDRTPLGNFYRDLVMRADAKNTFTPMMQAGYLRGSGNNWHIQPAKVVNGTPFARMARWVSPRELERAQQTQKYPYVKKQDDERVPAARLYMDEKTWFPLERHAETHNAFKLWVKLGPFEYHSIRGFLKIKSSYVADARAKPTEGYEPAIVVFSGNIDKKRHETVMFLPDQAAKPEALDERLIQAYRDQVSPEQTNLLGQHGALRPEQPIFYRKLGDTVAFFGHTMMLRMSYGHSPNDFVPEALRDSKVTDLAEAMFGATPRGNDKRPARAGRVFVTDALCEGSGDTVWLAREPFSPKILASPKATTFQHYLVQQVPDDQIVDYARDGKPQYQAALSHYGSKSPDETVIRGHKLYWHRGEVDATKIGEQDQKAQTEHASQYTKFKPVRAGVPFSFCIHFENLSQVEIGALLWILNLPAEHYPKLGMGKPLGMGAVQLQATPVVRERTSRYKKLLDANEWFEGNDDDNFDAETCRKAFNDFVLASMDPNERGDAKRLEELKRIQAFLEILKWRDDSPLLHYMDLKQFRHRPVLPDPFGIEEPQARPAGPREQTTSKGAMSAPASQAPVDIPTPKPEVAPPPPKSKIYREGDIFTGTVQSIEEDGAVSIAVPGWDYENTYAIIEVQDLGGKQFRPGNPARCLIQEIVRAGNGITVYYSIPAPRETK